MENFNTSVVHTHIFSQLTVPLVKAARLAPLDTTSLYLFT